MKGEYKMLTMENVRRVETFGDAYTLLDELMPEFVESLDDERKTALVHFCDYEALSYCVLSDFNRQEQVVFVYDNICGDTCGVLGSLEEFKKTVMDEIEEDIEE